MRFPLLRIAAALLWSTVVWTTLWSDLSVANVFWGVVIGCLVLILVPLPARWARVVVRPVAALRLGLHFAWALVRASAIVAWEIVTPRNRIHQGIVATPLRTRSPGLITTIANMITLTPGTVTLEVQEDPPILYVHVLHLRTIDQVRGDIRRLEELTLAAFAVEREPQTREP